jgi:hypothetical protein
MFRRLISIVLVCASLLGLAHPLMACAAATQSSDCCTGDPASGCMTDGAPMLTTADAECCAVTPVAPTLSIALPTRPMDHALPPGGSNGPVLPAHVDDKSSRSPATRSLAFAQTTSNRTDATLTYLRTARLRL